MQTKEIIVSKIKLWESIFIYTTRQTLTYLKYLSITFSEVDKCATQIHYSAPQNTLTVTTMNTSEVENVTQQWKTVTNKR